MLKLYVGFTFLHHGKHSGYNQIKRHLDYDKIIDCQNSFNFLNRFLKKRTIFSRLYGKLLGGNLWWIEVQMIFLSIFHPNKYIFHIIYGENIFNYLGYFKFNNKIVLTLHQPVSYFEQPQLNKYIKRLQRVDKIIVMSKELELFFNELLINTEVVFIPHGVESNFFKSEGIKEDTILLLGNWLRNFRLASDVFSRIEELKINCRIRVITNIENHHFFIENKNVEVFHKISDLELLRNLQSAKIVFLPLLEFTANNAVLEASSCGCKVIIATKKDNFSPEMFPEVDFIIEDSKAIASSIEWYLENWNQSIEKKSRDFIINNYSWNVIGKKTESLINLI